MDFEYDKFYERAYERYWKYFLELENIEFQESYKKKQIEEIKIDEEIIK